MPGRKEYSGGAETLTLSGDLTGGDLTVNSAETPSSGWPLGTNPFVIVIGRGTSNEEKLLVTSRSGTAFTIDSRGYDDTSATAHSSGELIEHVLDADTVDEANDHVNDDTRDDHSQYVPVDGSRGFTAHPDGLDHGNLDGLADDDHTQYLNNARHQADDHSFVDHGDLVGLTDDDHPQYIKACQLVKFTADGTFTKADYPGLKFVRVRAVGGGGAGGGTGATSGTQNAAGAGGGGGGYTEMIIPAASLLAAEPVTIGAGGANAVGGNGGDGGVTSFGAHLTAAGGTGGELGTGSSAGKRVAPGSGGGGSGGDKSVFGDDGGWGQVIEGAFNMTGTGGGGAFSPSQRAPNDSAGFSGQDKGGGGSGATATSSSPARAGGAGDPGLVLVEVFT